MSEVLVSFGGFKFTDQCLFDQGFSSGQTQGGGGDDEITDENGNGGSGQVQEE